MHPYMRASIVRAISLMCETNWIANTPEELATAGKGPHRPLRNRRWCAKGAEPKTKREASGRTQVMETSVDVYIRGCIHSYIRTSTLTTGEVGERARSVSVVLHRNTILDRTPHGQQEVGLPVDTCVAPRYPWLP